MTEINLVNGKLYWGRLYWAGRVDLLRWWSMGGEFEMFGTDVLFSPYEIEILGEAELIIPEYAKDTGYGN